MAAFYNFVLNFICLFCLSYHPSSPSSVTEIHRHDIVRSPLDALSLLLSPATCSLIEIALLSRHGNDAKRKYARPVSQPVIFPTVGYGANVDCLITTITRLSDEKVQTPLFSYLVQVK